MITGLTMMAMAAATNPIDAATRAAILDSARAPVVAALGKPVLFRVNRLRQSGDFVFLLADMEDKGGKPLDYAGTPRAEDAANGVVSRSYAALLRRTGNGWEVVANAIGPTDVAWLDWPARYGAPRDIIDQGIGQAAGPQ